MLKTNSLLFKTVATLMMSVMTSHSVVIAADGIKAAADQAKVFGKEIIAQDFMPSQGTNNTINMPFNSGGGSINIADLYPGTSANNSKDSSFYFPNEGTTDLNQLKDAHNSEKDVLRMGNETTAALIRDSKSDNPSIVGMAYQIGADQANRQQPNLDNDPMFKQSKEVIGNISQIAQEFADCRETSSFTQKEYTEKAHDYEYCHRPVDVSQACIARHVYKANFLEHHAGPQNIKRVEGANAIQAWIGRVGNNYWSGSCKIYTQETFLKVNKPEAITKVTLEYAKWDDYMQVWVGEKGKEKLIWDGPYPGVFPPETPGQCELSRSWERNLNVDVTDVFHGLKDEAVVRFYIRASVSGKGEAYARLRFDYDPAKAVWYDEWEMPAQCENLIKAKNDNLAKVTAQCSAQPANIEADNCAYIGNVKVCESYLKPSPIEGISPLCQEVRITGELNYPSGTLTCYTDINGNKQCPTTTGKIENTCKALEARKECGFIKSECVDSATGKSGLCYVQSETWDCGKDIPISTVAARPTLECPGAVRCMGKECADPDFGENATGDFAKVSALLQAAQMMGQDMSCSGVSKDEQHGVPTGGGTVTGTEDVVCRVFGGKGNECKVAVGGIQNCCEKPKGIGLHEYIGLITAVGKLDTAITSIKATSGTLHAIKSGYSALRQPIVNAFETVSKPFTSMMDSISSAYDGVKQFADEIIKKVTDKIKDLFTKAFGKIAQETGGAAAGGAAGGAGTTAGMESAGAKAANQITTQLASAVSVISTVYTIYSVTMLAIKMIYKCTEDELDLTVQMVLRNVHYIGQYCKTEVLGMCVEKRRVYCQFKSPLSRILQEQIRRQQGRTFGTTDNPDCRGFTVEELEEVDWSMVDLGEWTAILGETGHLPDPKTMAIQNLTGAGTTLDLGSRIDAAERTQKRFDGIDVDRIRRESGNLQHSPIPTTP